MESTHDQIVLIGQTGMLKGSQQVIPATESDSKNDVKLDENGITVEPSQNEKKTKILENTLSEANETNQIEEKKSENSIAGALSTLPTGVENVISKIIPPRIKQVGPAWCDVGIIRNTKCLVNDFFLTSITDDHENTNLDQLPDYTNQLKIDIQPNTAYKFRIAAINACGRGEWSEITTFKTCLPGYPDAPSEIKVTKSSDGINLTWKDLPISSGKILEYTVCLAIKSFKEKTPQNPKPHTSLSFARVYCGPRNATVVSHEVINAAFIDRTNKPAIIFRIAAKNEKGYGQATQVRWLQDNNVLGSNKNLSLKREKSVSLLTGFPKIPKI